MLSVWTGHALRASPTAAATDDDDDDDDDDDEGTVEDTNHDNDSDFSSIVYVTTKRLVSK